MSKSKPEPPRIELLLEGPAVQGRISVDMLTTVARELQGSLRRMLASPRRARGRFPKVVEHAGALDLIGFRNGSAVLTFEYAGQRDANTLHGDLGVRVAEEMLEVMQKAEAGESVTDDGLPAGVLEGWEALSKPLHDGGVDSMRIALIHGSHRREVRLTRMFRQGLYAGTVREPGSVETTIEGVLWECDWKRHSAELDEADGNRVTLELDSRWEERVTDLRRRRVRVRGTVAERRQGRLVRMAVLDVTPADNLGGAGDPRYGGFWENLSADELARRQGVGPVDDLAKLAGEWPPDDSIDEFLDFVREVRGG